MSADMADAPERIRVAQDDDGFWTCREAVSGSQEYVRADLYERLRKALNALDRMSRGVDWCDQDEQARRWSAARSALEGGE